MNQRGVVLFLGGVACALIFGWFVFPIALYKSQDQPMQFSHATHTGEKAGMSCSDCHFPGDDGRFQGIPPIAKCTECHAAQLGVSDAEKMLVDEYVTPNKEIPWLVYSRQPDNAYFPHALHINEGTLKCEDCHGIHGQSGTLQPYQVNRISGYSRDIWGANISGVSFESKQGMKMDRCIRCHAEHGRRDGCIECHK